MANHLVKTILIENKVETFNKINTLKDQGISNILKV